MTTLPNMGIILPTLGGDRGSWDDKLNAGLTLIDAHDHTSGKGAAIVTAALNIDADLDFNGFGATGLGRVVLEAVPELSTGSLALFVNEDDNELYFRTSGGTNIQLTSGTTINISLVGGIVGDYTSVGAEVAYDDANDQYTFKQDGTKPWARIACGPVRIYEYNTLETVYIELATAAALAASYTITLPAALPASQTLMQISAAGIVSFTNTLATNANITLSGTGYIKTGTRTVTIPLMGTDCISGAASVSTTAPATVVAAAGTVWFPIRGVPREGRIQSVVVHSVTSVNITTYTLVISDTSAGGTVYNDAFSGTIAGTSTVLATDSVTITPTTPFTLGNGIVCWIKAVVAAGTDRHFISADINYDVP